MAHDQKEHPGALAPLGLELWAINNGLIKSIIRLIHSIILLIGFQFINNPIINGSWHMAHDQGERAQALTPPWPWTVSH